MWKIKLFFDDRKEEEWINKMAAQGWHFKRIFLRLYFFEKGEKGEYIYRCDLLNNFGMGKEVQEYIQFVESTGAELVYKKLHWVYFRQHRALGKFELYSDSASKLGYLNRMLVLNGKVGLFNLLLAIVNGVAIKLNGGTQLNHFLNGFVMGIFLVVFISTILLTLRRWNLKKQLALHEI
ncbi:MAG: DUF2812 domain-containing protein [Solibacillus sp.]